MVRKKTSSELEQAEIKLQSLMEKRDALNAEAQQARQERDLVHEKKREVGVRLRPLKDRRASFAAEARAHREKRDELQAKAKALIELKRKLRASGPTDVGAELRALTRRVSQLEMRQQTASLSLSKENELIDELKASMKRLKVLQSLKADQDKIVKEVRDLDSGITDLFRAAACMSDALIKSIGDGLDYNASILYSFEENPAGTAGAVRRVGNFFDDTFVVSMGDILCDVDFKALYDFHKRKGAAVTIALTEVADPTQYGVVGLDPNGRIVKFKEKPKKEEAFSNLVNAGIYVLEPSVLEFVPPDQKFDFAKDLFPKLLSKGLGLFGSKIDGVWMDIGQPHDLWKASMAIVSREGRPLHRKDVTSEGPVILDPTAQIEPGVTIRGPCYVGPAVVLGKGSVVDNACLYEAARLDPDARVEKSIILEGSTVGSAAEIVDSVVSRNCVIGDGARIVSSIIGEGMTVRAGSKLENATVSLPPR